MTRNQVLTTATTARNSVTASTIWARLRLLGIIAVIVVACLMMTACDEGEPVIYTFEGVLGDPPPPFDDAILLGVWRLEKEGIEFQRIGHNHFRMRGAGESDGDDDYYDFRIVAVDNNLFFDMWQKVKPEIATQPLHFTCKLGVQQTTFTLSCLSSAFLTEHGPDEIPRVQIENRIILTGSPTALRDLYVKYANDENAFPVTWTFHRPDLQKLETLRQTALQGDPAAEEALGHEYTSGENVDENADEAVRWISAAAHHGRASAEFDLGKLYLRGYSSALPQDYDEAMRWFLKASEQGHAGAMYHVGQAHEHGWGVRVDLTEAAQWYAKAADLGHAEAHMLLGDMSAHGSGVPLDEQAALVHYDNAVKLDASLATAWNGLASLYLGAANHELRNANKALGCARKAVELTRRKDPGYLATLAEAYAFRSQPKKAAAVASEAVKITANEDLKRRLEKFTAPAD